MTLPTVCILLTGDPELARRLSLDAAEVADIRTVASRGELERWQERTGPTPLLLDLRHADSAGLLAEATPEARATLVAFGLPDSSPFLACRDAGLFAVEALSCTPAQWRQTVRQVAAVVRLQEERDGLRQRLAPLPRPSASARTDGRGDRGRRRYRTRRRVCALA